MRISLHIFFSMVLISGRTTSLESNSTDLSCMCSSLSKTLSSGGQMPFSANQEERGKAVVKKVKIGLIGTGMVSQQYIKGCREFDILDLVACSDIDLGRATAIARQWNIPKACPVEELLADPEIQIVINLTIPQAHVPVSEAVVGAGKHVYSEKPLAATPEDGKRLLVAARENGVRVGCAPDTFLGGGQ